jgi:ABC-type Mn2+/Zn2+ transport system ATPase subunit
LILKNYKNISYVPQKIQFDSSIPLSVGEFFHIYNPKITEKEINEKTEVFLIKNLQEKRISSLS